jgi:Zn-dependent protease with chaperone function
MASQVRGGFALFTRLTAVAIAFAAVADSPLPTPALAALSLGSWRVCRLLQLGFQYPWEYALLARARPPRARLRDIVIWLSWVPSVAYVAWMPSSYDLGGKLWAALGCSWILLQRSRFGAYLVRPWLSPARAAALEAVARASTAAGLPQPRVFEVVSPHVNAFAVGASTVGFTDSAVTLLDVDELALVARHELRHLSEGALERAWRAVLSLRNFWLIGLFPVIENRSHALVYGILGWWVTGRVASAFGHSLEHRADAFTSSIPEKAAYALVLQRIYELNLLTPDVTSSHPSLVDRMAAAGIKNKKAKRSRPSGSFGATAILGSVVVLLILRIACDSARDAAELPHVNDERTLTHFLALRSDGPGLLIAASHWSEQGATANARIALEAANAPELSFETSLLLAGMRARTGNCEAARQLLDSLPIRCESLAECEDRAGTSCKHRTRSFACPVLVPRELQAVAAHCGDASVNSH